MVEIPILVSTPGLHTLPAQEEYYFTQTAASEDQTTNPRRSPVETPVAVKVNVSHLRQTDAKDPSTKRATPPQMQSPAHSRSSSRTRSSKPRVSWAEQLRTRLSSPHSQTPSVAVDPSGRALLAAPVETPQRPTTPAADLYRGQNEGNFGMTFDDTDHAHFRKAAKPTACAYSYEDRKHRMMMDWLERRF